MEYVNNKSCKLVLIAATLGVALLGARVASAACSLNTAWYATVIISSVSADDPNATVKFWVIPKQIAGTACAGINNDSSCNKNACTQFPGGTYTSTDLGQYIANYVEPGTRIDAPIVGYTEPGVNNTEKITCNLTLQMKAKPAGGTSTYKITLTGTSANRACTITGG